MGCSEPQAPNLLLFFVSSPFPHKAVVRNSTLLIPAFQPFLEGRIQKRSWFPARRADWGNPRAGAIPFSLPLGNENIQGSDLSIGGGDSLLPSFRPHPHSLHAPMCTPRSTDR